MKERKVPMRKCVGCMQSKEKQALIRIAAYEGQISVDPSGRAKGRGVYICKNSPDCREKAEKRRALERSWQLLMMRLTVRMPERGRTHESKGHELSRLCCQGRQDCERL